MPPWRSVNWSRSPGPPPCGAGRPTPVSSSGPGGRRGAPGPGPAPPPPPAPAPAPSARRGPARPASLWRWTADAGLVEWARRETGRPGAGPGTRPRTGTGPGTVSAAVPVDPSAFTVRHVRYPSADGTEIGLFLVHRRDHEPDA